MKPLAPAPVHYRLAPFGGLFWVLAALLATLGGVLLAWLLALRQAQQAGVVLWVAVAMAYGAACVWSWRTARALPSGWLVWTGKCWQLQKTPNPLRAQSLSAGPLPGQMGETASVHAPNSHSADLAKAGFEAAGAPFVEAYAACSLVLDMQRAALLRLRGPQGLQGLQGRAAEPGTYRGTARGRWADGRQPVHGAAAPAVWVWASRASAPAHWHALRCALVWAQTQGLMEADRAAGGPPAPVARTVEAGPASQVAPVASASTAQSGHADGGDSALGELATASAWADMPGQHGGAP